MLVRPFGLAAIAAAFVRFRPSRRASIGHADCHYVRDAAAGTDTYAALGPHGKQQIVGCMPPCPESLWLASTVDTHRGIQDPRNTGPPPVELRNRAPELPYIPVLQGWTPQDYLRCIELYQNAGVNLTKVPSSASARSAVGKTPPRSDGSC